MHLYTHYFGGNFRGFEIFFLDFIFFFLNSGFFCEKKGNKIFASCLSKFNNMSVLDQKDFFISSRRYKQKLLCPGIIKLQSKGCSASIIKFSIFPTTGGFPICQWIILELGRQMLLLVLFLLLHEFIHFRVGKVYKNVIIWKKKFCKSKGFFFKSNNW